jgi:hypothetical protein
MKNNNEKYVYVNGIGGLGNCIFQIASAIYYAEKYEFKIILNNNSSELHFGTSNYTNRDKRKKINNIPISYKDTIFNTSYLSFETINLSNCDNIYNDYTDNKLYTINEKHLCIYGYCQNYNLFLPILNEIPKYFNLSDESIKLYLINKYKIDNTKHNIMVSIRAGDDFIHMNKITKKSYSNALSHIIKENPNNYNILIIADNIDKIHFKFELPNDIEYKIIDEDDIAQFYAGLMCSSFILCESTYHYWIALIKYINDKNTDVYCFLDTDLTNRPLALPEWNKIPY